MNRERYILQKREYEYRKQLKLKAVSGQPLTFKERNVLNIILKNERKGK
jgi:hypothetical protein